MSEQKRPIFGSHRIESEYQMRQLGYRLGKELRAGDLLVLKGPLGAGKTTMTQAIASVFGITDVTSPTFIIVREHAASIPFIHVDLYRLLGSEKTEFEFDDLDLHTRRENAIIVMEWGSDLALRLGENYIFIDIAFTGDFTGDHLDSNERREVLVERR